MLKNPPNLACVVPFYRIGPYLGPYGCIWAHLAQLGPAWPHLAPLRLASAARLWVKCHIRAQSKNIAQSRWVSSSSIKTFLRCDESRSQNPRKFLASMILGLNIKIYPSLNEFQSQHPQNIKVSMSFTKLDKFNQNQFLYHTKFGFTA